jgi:hypothetical protein
VRRAVKPIGMGMEPEFFQDGKKIEHPLEHLLKASGWAILTAIERQRMAVMNAKGQLAEYYLNKLLEDLQEKCKVVTGEQGGRLDS